MEKPGGWFAQAGTEDFLREVLSKETGPFLKISFFFRCFPHNFAIAYQLHGFSISSLGNVEDVFNINIFFKCKYKCEYTITHLNISV